MIVLNCKIQWWRGPLNSPEAMLLVDKIPDHRNIIHQINTNRNILHFYAEDDGYVHVLARNKDLSLEEAGFGGWRMELDVYKEIHELARRTYSPKVEHLKFKGAWSSRSGIINRYFSPHCVEVALTDSASTFTEITPFPSWVGGLVTVDVLREALDRFCPDVELVRVDRVPRDKWHSYETFYYLKLRDVTKPCELCKGFGTINNSLGRNIDEHTCYRCNGSGQRPSQRKHGFDWAKEYTLYSL